MPPSEYQRLTRPRARAGFAVAFMSRSSLWLATDHLLSVETSGYAESYKCFYFRDIQAVTTQRTTRWEIWNIIWGVGMVACLVLTLATKPAGGPADWNSDQMAGGIVLLILNVLFITGLLINWLFGETCKVFLRTAVQIEELSSLKRMRQARKIMEKIRPQIIAAQGGELTPEIMAARMQEQFQAPAGTAPAAPAETSPQHFPETPKPLPVENPDVPPRLDT